MWNSVAGEHDSRHGQAVHPEAPGSATGAGSSRRPGPLNPADTACHPDAPASRSREWAVAGLHPTTAIGGGGFSAGSRDVAEQLAALVKDLRRHLPDTSLQPPFDLHVTDLELARGRGTPWATDAASARSALAQLHLLVSWIDADLFAAVAHEAVGPSNYLRGFTRVAQRTAAAAEQRLAGRWADASRGGAAQQQALLLEWTQRLRARADGRPTGTGDAAAHRADQPAPQTPSSLAAPAVVPDKTWVEFQMVDEDDLPVAGVAYEVTLPTGAHRSGRTGASGLIRFEQITPGQCRIRFPEIDAAEWKQL